MMTFLIKNIFCKWHCRHNYGQLLSVGEAQINLSMPVLTLPNLVTTRLSGLLIKNITLRKEVEQKQISQPVIYACFNYCLPGHIISGCLSKRKTCHCWSHYTKLDKKACLRAAFCCSLEQNFLVVL